MSASGRPSRFRRVIWVRKHGVSAPAPFVGDTQTADFNLTHYQKAVGILRAVVALFSSLSDWLLIAVVTLLVPVVVVVAIISSVKRRDSN